MVDSRRWSVKENNDPFVVPSFETISFSLPTMQHWEQLLQGKDDGWVYLSDGNPTLASLELALCQIQGTQACWVTSTGNASGSCSACASKSAAMKSARAPASAMIITSVTPAGRSAAAPSTSCDTSILAAVT